MLLHVYTHPTADIYRICLVMRTNWPIGYILKWVRVLLKIIHFHMTCPWKKPSSWISTSTPPGSGCDQLPHPLGQRDQLVAHRWGAHWMVPALSIRRPVAALGGGSERSRAAERRWETVTAVGESMQNAVISWEHMCLCIYIVYIYYIIYIMGYTLGLHLGLLMGHKYP
jgi:hypothetical protein